MAAAAGNAPSETAKSNTDLFQLTMNAEAISDARVIAVKDELGLKIAEAAVVRSVKGPAVGRRIAFVASTTGICDTTTAVEGETALLFLERTDGDALPPAARQAVQQWQQQHRSRPLYALLHRGSGRIPILESGGAQYVRARPAWWARQYLAVGDLVMLPRTVRRRRLGVGASKGIGVVRVSDILGEVRKTLRSDRYRKRARA